MNCKNCKYFRKSSDIFVFISLEKGYSREKQPALFGSCKLSTYYAYYKDSEEIQKKMKEVEKPTFGGDNLSVHENFGCINFKPNE